MKGLCRGNQGSVKKNRNNSSLLLEVCKQEDLKYRGVGGKKKKKRKEKFHARRNKRLWD